MSHWREFLDPEARGGRYLPWKEVARATGLSRTTAWRLQKRDDFPAAYTISPGRVGYREHEVEAWRASRGLPGARLGRQPTQIEKAAATAASSGKASQSQAEQSEVTPASTATLSPPPAREPAGRPHTAPANGSPTAKRGKSARRRSEHARAIAQQMLFDF